MKVSDMAVELHNRHSAHEWSIKWEVPAHKTQWNTFATCNLQHSATCTGAEGNLRKIMKQAIHGPSKTDRPGLWSDAQLPKGRRTGRNYCPLGAKMQPTAIQNLQDITRSRNQRNHYITHHTHLSHTHYFPFRIVWWKIAEMA